MKHTLIVIVVLAAMLAGCGGTPRERVANAERSYQAAAAAATLAVKAGLVTGSEKLNLIKTANDEANEALADANARVQVDAKFDTEFWLNRVGSAISRLAELTSKAKVK